MAPLPKYSAVWHLFVRKPDLKLLTQSTDKIWTFTEFIPLYRQRYRTFFFRVILFSQGFFPYYIRVFCKLNLENAPTQSPVVVKNLFYGPFQGNSQICRYNNKATLIHNYPHVRLKILCKIKIRHINLVSDVSNLPKPFQTQLQLNVQNQKRNLRPGRTWKWLSSFKSNTLRPSAPHIGKLIAFAMQFLQNSESVWFSTFISFSKLQVAT